MSIPHALDRSSAQRRGAVQAPTHLLAGMYAAACVAVYLIGGRAPNLILVIFGSGLLVFESAERQPGDGAIYILLAAGTIGLMARSVVHGTLAPLGVIPYLMAAGGAAFALRRGHLSRNLLAVLAMIAAVFLLSAFVQGVFPNNVLPGRSRNHISVLVLGLAAMLVYDDARSHRDVRIWPAAFAALASLWAVGRSGILAAAVLLGAALWVNRARLRTREGLAVLALLGAGFVWLWSRYGAAIQAFVRLSTHKFRERGLESDVRLQILFDYTRGMDWKALLFGQQEFVVNWIGLTLHSSYLVWHLLFGVLAVVPAYFSAVTLFRALRRHSVLAMVLLAILLRSLTDTVLFPGIFFDPVFFAIIAHFHGVVDGRDGGFDISGGRGAAASSAAQDMISSGSNPCPEEEE